MSNTKQYSSNIYEFVEVLGLSATRNPDFETIHEKLGTTTGLHQGIFTLNYLLRYTLDPKVGDTTNIRAHSKKLLVFLDQCTAFNVMDYIYECIKEASYEQVRSCPFAPYIQKLINHMVTDQRFKMDHKHKVYKPKKELCIKDMRAPSSRPNIKRAKNYVPRQEDEGTSFQVSQDAQLSQMSTKDLLTMLLQTQVALNAKINRSMYLQKRLRTDYRMIKKALTKILVERGDIVQDED